MHLKPDGAGEQFLIIALGDESIHAEELLPLVKTVTVTSPDLSSHPLWPFSQHTLLHEA